MTMFKILRKDIESDIKDLLTRSHWKLAMSDACGKPISRIRPFIP